MKILVCIKRVVDFNVRVQVKPDGSGVAIDGAKMSVNPFDEIALEEALRFRDQGDAEEVIVLTVGSSASQQQLRTALAMGADRAVLVESDEELQALEVARAILKITEKESPGLVFLGKQAIDDDNNQTGQMLAALWRRPQATFASRISVDNGVAKVTREVDAGLETVEVDLPAVLTTDLRLNEPRFVKLPDIMKAKRKPLEVLPLADLGCEKPPEISTISYAAPAARSRGVIVDDVPALLNALKEKGVL